MAEKHHLTYSPRHSDNLACCSQWTQGKSRGGGSSLDELNTFGTQVVNVVRVERDFIVALVAVIVDGQQDRGISLPKPHDIWGD